jgi:hypothetical protein
MEKTNDQKPETRIQSDLLALLDARPDLPEAVGWMVNPGPESDKRVQASAHRPAVRPKREAGKPISDKQLPAKGQWWAMQDLNLRLLPCEGSTLPLS